MKILFIGDIFARPGRKLLQKILPEVIAEHQPDIVIGNVENLAGGKGVNRRSLQEIASSGVDVFTGGNHSFDNLDGNEVYQDSSFPLLRPANFPRGTPGRGWGIFTAKNGERLLLISLLGRTFMPQHADSPFHCVEDVLAQVPEDEYDVSMIDFHAEATSEKHALLWKYNGRITAIVGTHTHVPTADADITPAGTAFQSDAGMNGSLDSCIGIKSDLVIKKLMDQMPLKYEVETTGRMQFNGVLIETQGRNATKIQHLRKVISRLS
ncbi:MAG: YmdB family metallophosphoesterase [Candidatus Altimarinota bacterium]